MIPAWLYFAGPIVTALVGALSATVISHYRKVQSGQLVPRITVDLMVAHYTSRYNEVAAERDDWKQTSRVLTDTTRIQAAQIDELTESTRVQEAIMRSLPSPRPDAR